MKKVKKLDPKQNGKHEVPEVKVTEEKKTERVRKQMVFSFTDTGQGFDSEIKVQGFSIFEQIGILESVKQNMILENFSSKGK